MPPIQTQFQYQMMTRAVSRPVQPGQDRGGGPDGRLRRAAASPARASACTRPGSTRWPTTSPTSTPSTRTSENAFQARWSSPRPARWRRGRRRHRARRPGRACVVNDPDNPLADADGNVRAPAMDLASQMTPAGHGPARLPGLGAGHQERPGHLHQRAPDRRPADDVPVSSAAGFTPYVRPRERTASSAIGSLQGAAGSEPAARTSAAWSSTGIDRLESVQDQSDQLAVPGRHR